MKIPSAPHDPHCAHTSLWESGEGYNRAMVCHRCGAEFHSPESRERVRGKLKDPKPIQVVMWSCGKEGCTHKTMGAARNCMKRQAAEPIEERRERINREWDRCITLFVEGYTYKNISEIVGFSVAGVRQRILWFAHSIESRDLPRKGKSREAKIEWLKLHQEKLERARVRTKKMRARDPEEIEVWKKHLADQDG